jgi:hypothetical protein
VVADDQLRAREYLVPSLAQRHDYLSASLGAPLGGGGGGIKGRSFFLIFILRSRSPTHLLRTPTEVRVWGSGGGTRLAEMPISRTARRAADGMGAPGRDNGDSWVRSRRWVHLLEGSSRAEMACAEYNAFGVSRSFEHYCTIPYRTYGSCRLHPPSPVTRQHMLVV